MKLVESAMQRNERIALINRMRLHGNPRGAALTIEGAEEWMEEAARLLERGADALEETLKR